MAPLAAARPFPMDLCETDDALVLTATLPGIRREDMTVSVTEDTLIIEAKSAGQTHEKTSGLRHVSEQSQTLIQKIRLSPSVDIDHIQASYKDDVLTIILPKRRQPRKAGITIQVE
jgi:HSP20 family protein